MGNPRDYALPANQAPYTPWPNSLMPLRGAVPGLRSITEAEQRASAKLGGVAILQIAADSSLVCDDVGVHKRKKRESHTRRLWRVNHTKGSPRSAEQRREAMSENEMSHSLPPETLAPGPGPRQNSWDPRFLFMAASSRRVARKDRSQHRVGWDVLAQGAAGEIQLLIRHRLRLPGPGTLRRRHGPQLHGGVSYLASPPGRLIRRWIYTPSQGQATFASFHCRSAPA